jgi:hypothetical protein
MKKCITTGKQYLEGRILERNGKYFVEIVRCIWCNGLTLAPRSYTCSCGRENYPNPQLVPLGEAFDPTKIS